MRKRENWLFACAIIGAIAGVVKILEYFGITPKVVMPVAHSISGLISAILLFAFSISLSVFGIYTAKQRRTDLEQRLSEKSAAAQRRDEMIAERDQKISGLERENRQLKAPIPPPTSLTPPPVSEPLPFTTLLGLASQPDTPERQIKRLESEVEGCKAETEHYKDLWKEELGDRLRTHFDCARLTMMLIGSEPLVPRQLSVRIQFIGLDDSGLAKQIGQWLRDESLTPQRLPEIEQIPWKDNPGYATRIVVTSEDGGQDAAAVAQMVNMHGLLPEEMTVGTYTNETDSITVTIFTEPKKASK